MVSFTPRSRSYSGLKPSSSTAGVMSHCQLRCFIILYLSELSVLVVFRRFAQYSASKDTTFNIINGHLRRITNGFPSSFRIRSEKHGSGTPCRLPEIGAAGYLFLYPQENSLHDILDVNKRQILPAETHGEVRVPTDRLCHQEVILLARSVHTRRTIDDVRKIRHALQIPLRFQFAKAIGGIGHRGILSVIGV